MTTYETIKQLSQMPEYNSPNITVELSNGELCANKYCNEIFDIFHILDFLHYLLPY